MGVNHRYHPFYCEENIWHLCHALSTRQDKVVFISNEQRHCSMWHMRLAAKGAPIHWDYHVILLHRDGRSWEIWDLDTSLGLPVPALTYIRASFGKPHQVLCPPFFRLVDASRFRTVFSSDRSHMALEGGQPKDPPPWPPVLQGTNNLARFLAMDSDFMGPVLDLPALIDFVSQRLEDQRGGAQLA